MEADAACKEANSIAMGSLLLRMSTLLKSRPFKQDHQESHKLNALPFLLLLGR